MTERRVLIPEAPDLPYRLGRSVQHDERSKAYRAVTSPVPIKDKLHRRWGPLLHQANVGACTYFGLLGALHHRPLYRSGQRYSNDEGFAGYARCTEIDPFPGTWRVEAPHGQDTGSSGLAACQVAKEKGLISGYDHAFGFHEYRQALMDSTVMVGTVWFESMFDVPASGILECRGDEVGGHLYLSTGYDADRKMSRILCAWKRWGVQSQQWAWLRDADLMMLLERWGDCTVPRREAQVANLSTDEVRLPVT